MKNILRWNAELARNMWLELSPQRLIMTPVIIFLVIALIAMNADDRAAIIIHYFSLGLFGLFGGIWGLKNAADSVLDEYNDKTWDWQRMSIIGPWKLAIGKLFGSTIFNWYIALIGFVFFIASSFRMDNPVEQIKMGIISLISMAAIHGLMIMISLLMLRRGDGRTKIRSNRIFILGIFLILVIYRPISAGLFFGGSFFNISWYGLFSTRADIAILNAIFYCGWVIAGLYRSMRSELQFTDKPTWWLTFIVSNFFFQYGYVATSASIDFAGGMAIVLGLMLFQTLVLTYFMALAEPKDIINFRLLSRSFAERDFDTFFRNVPLWLVTLPIAFVFGLLTVILLQIAKTTGNYGFLGDILGQAHSGKAFLFLIAAFGFVLRDLGILLLLSFSIRPRRASGAMVLYMAVLYALLPALTHKLSFGAIFYPDPTVNSLLMVFFPIVEAAIVLYFAWDRWKQISSAKAVV